MQLRFARYDKGGEETYNMLSAFHKSLRGSDPQGALYWMARMIEGGAGSDDRSSAARSRWRRKTSGSPTRRRSSSRWRRVTRITCSGRRRAIFRWRR